MIKKVEKEILAVFTKRQIPNFMFTAVFVIFGLSGVVVAEAASFSQYNPSTLGSYWTYQNVADHTDTYTVSVFENFFFAGHPAAKIGTGTNDYGIGYNDGTNVNMYGYVKSGVLYNSAPVSIGTVTDGLFYQLGEPFNFQLIRIWDNLDPISKAAYNIDPALTQILLIAAYDSSYAPNNQNAIVQSNLGITLPDYAVTHLEWYQIGVGMITTIDIFAGDGTIGNRYDLIDHYIAPNPVPEPSTMLLIGIGLAIAGLVCSIVKKTYSCR